MRFNKFLGLWAVVGVLGCAVQQQYLAPTYKEDERQRVKRVALLVDDAQKIAKLDRLFLDMAREHVSHKKEYILYPLEKEVVDVQKTSLLKICKSQSQLDGLLVHHWEKFSPHPKRLKLQMRIELIDCKNLKTVWKAVYGDSYETFDPGLAPLVRSWESKVGQDISEYVGPFYHFLDDLYFSLPDPVLSEQDITEKVEKDSEV